MTTAAADTGSLMPSDEFLTSLTNQAVTDLIADLDVLSEARDEIMREREEQSNAEKEAAARDRAAEQEADTAAPGVTLAHQIMRTPRREAGEGQPSAHEWRPASPPAPPRSPEDDRPRGVRTVRSLPPVPARARSTPLVQRSVSPDAPSRAKSQHPQETGAAKARKALTKGTKSIRAGLRKSRNLGMHTGDN
jgi:hypothetical protein